MKFWQRSKITGYLVVAISLLVLAPRLTLAAVKCDSDHGESNMTFDYTAGPEDIYMLEQPFGGQAAVSSIGEYIQLVYQFAVGLVSIIAVVLIMIGGLRWIAAAGNESTITEAKEMITSAVMGLIIALLSYSLLVFINPELTDVESKIAKIPIPLACGTPDPVAVSIPTIDGLNGNGKQLCAGAVTALQSVAIEMRKTCPTCTIVVSSGLRTHESQAALFACYTQSAAAAAAAAGKKTVSFNGKPCVAGCSGCNVAAPPCCSNHETGTAVDLYLTGSNVGLASSAGYLSGYNNNGESGGDVSAGAVGGDCSKTKNPNLCLNQQNLRKFMTATGSKFTGIAIEWWHFDFKGVCSLPGGTCTPIAGKANNSYCKADGEPIYTLADCDGTPSCPTSAMSKSWVIVNGSCPLGQHYEFASGEPVVYGTDGYATVPVCIAD